ncbi:helix-turn-helix domain-containing protein [Paracoccus onubensis]|uniref:TrmB family transcriptional regulator n=1 Tax=Paracoccus onubensis TaxID=1675788 RepID=UPI0027306F22|nr:TrmB family transcriptional regulator [Paracoccus onubensis]MDP0926194.1 helix-turn-helix domain-containing protein [Paracoccus onubensis]
MSEASNAPADVISDLRKLGLTEYEGRVYFQLLCESPATAYEIAKAANLPRPNTYNALESLVQRGAVLPVSESPARYVAAPPEQFLDSVARRTSTLCTAITSRLKDVARPIDDQYVWTLRGVTNVHDKIASLIDGSQESLMIKASDEILRRHTDSLRAAAERGVEMLMVLFASDVSEFRFGPNCKVYSHEGNGVRMGKTDNLFTIAADHVEMVTAQILEVVVAVHTRNEPIVTMAESLVRHDFYMAEIFQRFGPQIDDAFGPYLRDLRLACFTPAQADSFRLKTGIRD